MAVNGKYPYVLVQDTNGRPIVGAKLYVYEAGTTTPRAIYSDDGLSISLSNPLEGVNASNARGLFPKFYMAAGTYKLRAETSAGALIWEEDDLDTGLSAGAGALPISAGGTSATTAAAARAALDVPSNSELADLSADLASVVASVQSIVGLPQGRLTLTSNTPILASGVSAGTAVYYTPYVGTQLPIYSGSVFEVKTFAELTLTLHSNHVANAIYDVFIWTESGVVTIGTGPAWNTATAGAGARGTGGGTTELTRVNGLWVNANSMTTRNGSTTYTVSANRGTYVGSIYMDGTNGQVSCLTAWGQNRKWGVWNAYNRKKIELRCGDSTASWAASTTFSTFAQSNGATGNKNTTFVGLPEEIIENTLHQTISCSSTSNEAFCGIGINSTTTATGTVGRVFSNLAGAIRAMVTANNVIAPGIGINNVNSLDATTTAATIFGTEVNMVLRSEWQG